MTLTPAERYALSQARNKHPLTAKFQGLYDFPFDEFQVEACYAIERGDGVLVAAPTGAGKTVVGEFSAFLALHKGGKSFYTTPIKALSNQKYQELVATHGEDSVGLLTGDSTVNPGAPLVVMTTEVLRNMIYTNSHNLENLMFVVMDEVHYLADRFRGAVWEEILIHLPERIQVISLSATVSNAEEFGEWLQTVRGNTQIVVSELRPVPLYQHVLFGNRLLDLFVDDGRVNPEILRLERDALRPVRIDRTHHRTDRHNRGARTVGPELLSRAEVILKLDREGLLPAITFIFSRNACDAAVRQCVSAGIRLTTESERAQIRMLVAEKIQGISDEDLTVLGFFEWIEALERGIAAHHAGLLPVFKEVVEHLFQRGIIKAIFATETLALGINMPARTVVLEKLSKWNGQGHVPITAGEYTQLTGRAGRRGIDIEGNAVILWTKDVDSTSLAGLASTRTYPLKSSFKPTYNMTINLIQQFGSERARTSLESSFAQFQADRSVVGLARQIRRNEEAITELWRDVECHLGDFTSYATLRFEIKELERNLNRGTRRKAEVLEREERLGELRSQLRAHPCHGCAERESHSRIAERAERLRRETAGLTERVANRTNVIAKRFDRLHSLLIELEYIKAGEISDAGKRLSKIYSESDLLISEAIQAGLLHDLTVPELVATLSTFLYEARKEENPKIPHGRMAQILHEVIKLWQSIHDQEINFAIEPIRPPEFGFTVPAFRWASGHSLSSILKGTELTVGDFVRSMKQIIDLLRQLSIAAPELTEISRLALNKIDRGVVAYSGVFS